MSVPSIKIHRINFAEVSIGDLTIWFSYRTPIAFHSPATGLVVRRNDWGPTTGRHMAEVDGGDREARAERIPGDMFAARLEEATGSRPVGWSMVEV